MKKIVAVALLIVVLFLFVERQRLYVRDPLGSVTRNNVQESGAQVYVSFAGDVLLENDNPPIYLTLLQHGSRIGAPVHISCAHWIACLLEADVAEIHPAGSQARIESMAGKTVTFRDEEKRDVVVTLR